MKIYDITRLPSMIELGFDGENNWRPNSFDCSSLLANHPNGTISLWLLPHGETQAFPVALTRDGNSVVWTPLSDEMTAATGALQLVCIDGTDVGKSAVASFRVDESILPGADHPAAVPSWATQTIERAESAADRAEEAADSIDVEHLEQTIAAAVEAYLIEHPIEAPVQTVNGKTGVVVLDASDVGALPSDTPIPASVTEQTVAGWGFTKNTGDYSKPSGGIPKTDLASDVKTSLGKADTALQEHQSLAAYRTSADQDTIDAAQNTAIAAKYTKPSGGIPASDIADGVIPFEIPFVKQSDESWVFDPNSTLTSEEIFDGIKNAQGCGGVVAKVTTSNGDVLFYRALDALTEDGEPEDDPAALAEFIEFPFGDNYYYLHYIQVNPYSPDSDYWIETESDRMDFVQSTYVDNCISSALASTKTYFVRGIASAASLLTSSGTSVSYADLVNAQKGNNNVEIKAAMFDLDYNAQFKISEMLFNSQTGKSTVVLTDVTATKVVVATLTGTGETGALTGTVTTTSIEPELPAVAAADNGKFLRVVNGAWAAETVQTWQGGSY